MFQYAWPITHSALLHQLAVASPVPQERLKSYKINRTKVIGTGSQDSSPVAYFGFFFKKSQVNSQIFQQNLRLLIIVWNRSGMKEHGLSTLHPVQKDSFMANSWWKNHSLPKLTVAVIDKLRWMLQHRFRVVTSSPACLLPEDYHPHRRDKRRKHVSP